MGLDQEQLFTEVGTESLYLPQTQRHVLQLNPITRDLSEQG